MVVAIGNDREVPSNVSIYAGDFSRFLIVFNLVDYVSTSSEFSCDNTAVTLSLDPEYQNILSVAVDSAAAVGSVATIKFRDQDIMHVTFDEKPVPVYSDQGKTELLTQLNVTSSGESLMYCDPSSIPTFTAVDYKIESGPMVLDGMNYEGNGVISTLGDQLTKGTMVAVIEFYNGTSVVAKSYPIIFIN